MEKKVYVLHRESFDNADWEDWSFELLCVKTTQKAANDAILEHQKTEEKDRHYHYSVDEMVIEE